MSGGGGQSAAREGGLSTLGSKISIKGLVQENRLSSLQSDLIFFRKKKEKAKLFRSNKSMDIKKIILEEIKTRNFFESDKKFGIWK